MHYDSLGITFRNVHVTRRKSLLGSSLAQTYRVVLYEWRLNKDIGRLWKRELNETEEQAGKKAAQIKGWGVMRFVFCFELRIGQTYRNFEVVHCRTNALAFSEWLFPSDSSLVCVYLREQIILWPYSKVSCIPYGGFLDVDTSPTGNVSY